ncbi:MAG: DNA recombination protein RmuC [Holosporaceae bacterium]|jgi:DNA recombination protein RmuC|nr:DNA recombination protein RmuC [Holosporaceae bacterium]
MTETAVRIFLFVALIVVTAVAVFYFRTKLKYLISENAELRKFSQMYYAAVQEKLILEERCKNLSEKIDFLNSSEERLSSVFKAVSLDALSHNNQSFLSLAKATFEQLRETAKSDLAVNTKSLEGLVNPIHSALNGVGEKLNELEKSRVGAYEALKQQVKDLITTQNLLKTETYHLASALRSPTVRGRWGELQLRRVVELAGMLEHCDFCEQVSSEVDDAKIRPDMVVYFPEGQKVIVDAKVPLTAYQDALEVQDEESKKALLKEHAKQMRTHISALSKKKYWSQFDGSSEFVVMFLPGDILFTAALEQDPTLLEFSLQERVVLASPANLLALLHTIALGWRRQNLAENAKQVLGLGQELYRRLAEISQNIMMLGRNIGSTVTSYNVAVTNLENRVFSTARKFEQLEIHEKEITSPKIIENNIHHLQKTDFSAET